MSTEAVTGIAIATGLLGQLFVPWFVVLLAVVPVIIAVALVLLLRAREDATLQDASEALATVIRALKARSGDRPSP